MNLQSGTNEDHVRFAAEVGRAFKKTIIKTFVVLWRKISVTTYHL